MRILVFSSHFPNSVEPVLGSFVYKQLMAYPSDHELVVVAPVPFGLARRRKHHGTIPMIEEIELGNNKVKVYRPRYLLLPRNILRLCIGFVEFLLTFNTVNRIHRLKQIDLIHVHFAYPDGIAVQWITRLLKLPYIITEHRGLLRESLQNPWISRQLRTAYLRAKAVITVSDFGAKVLADYGVKATVIPNGLDLSRFSVAPAKAQPSKLVCIASLIPAKGIDFLIIAMSILRAHGKHYSLDLIGEGKHRPVLMELVKKLGLEQEISFLGQILPAKVESMLHDYDVLVMPSLRESFSMVIIEAMASGLPVIATRCGGPDNIVLAQTGILVEPGRAEALAEAILTMESTWEIYDPQIIRELAREHYSLDSVVQSYFNLYKSILSGEAHEN